ncbi:DUF2538 family protein [Paenibacillus taichungensis]|uniref:DUF2538 family protein n=1 Tax=Paenibacillus taichungensis TaxID=484184 RepID=UPI003830E32B
MHFVNTEHQTNFEKLVQKFNLAKSSPDYKSVCYIAAYPEIFKCFKLELQQESPFDWYYEYLDDPDTFQIRCDQGKTTGSVLSLNEPMVALIELALSLWTGRGFDLSHGIDVWIEELYDVAVQAIQLRRKSSKVQYSDQQEQLRLI